MRLWLDVEKGRDTTLYCSGRLPLMLWLDVEKGRDTTHPYSSINKLEVVA